MKKTFKTIALMCMIALAVATFAVGVVLAYFSLSNILDKDRDLSVNANEYTVLVSSDTDLLLYSRDNQYSQNQQISDIAGGNRYTIVFQNDITLTQNVFFNSDINLDLGGHSLILGDYSLTIEHGYTSVLKIGNGTISNAKSITSADGEVTTTYDGVGKLFVYAPNATVETISLTGEIVDISLDENLNKYLAYNSFFNVASLLRGEMDYVASRLTFAEVCDTSVNLSDESLYFNSEVGYFANNNLSLVSADLDLPISIYNSDFVEFSYSSSNTARLNNFGKYIQAAASDQVTLSVTLTMGEVSYSCDFSLKVLGTNDMEAEGLRVLQAYLSPYYKADNVTSTGSTLTGYFLTGDLSLPRYIGSIEYSYSATTDQGGSLSNILTVSEVSDNAYVLSPTSNIGRLYVSINGAAVTEYLNMYFLDDNTQSIRTNESVAREIINGWYKNAINIEQLDGNDDAYTSQDLKTERLNAYGIKTIEYTLRNNAEGTYTIQDKDTITDDCAKTLIVNMSSSVRPNLTQTVMLSIAVCLEEGTAVTGENDADRTVTLLVPVRYSVKTADTDNVSGFIPYYNYFNSIFEGRTALATANNFQMPLYYGSGRPVIALVFESQDERAVDAISFQVSYNSTTPIDIAKTKTTVNREGITYFRITCNEGLDAYINGTDGVTIDTLVANNAVWLINIDKSLLPVEDMQMLLFYQYKTTSSEAWASGSWALYENKTEDEETATVTYRLYTWTLCGVLQTSDMPDTTLYSWVYDNYSPNGDSDTTGTDRYILVDWLMQNITVNLVGMTISTFKGIEYLDGARIVNVSGLSVPESDLQYFAGMAALTELNLSNCGLSDRVNGAVDETITGYFMTLANAPALTILNLNDNAIYSFDFLTSITTLQDVYVSGQTITDTTTGLFYGTDGLANYSTYIALINRGVNVYTSMADQNGVSFANSGAGETYMALTRIIYQARLPENVSIENVYATLGHDIADYGLSNTLTDINGNTHTLDSQEIGFAYEGDDPLTATEFYLVYTVRIGTQEVSMNFVYSVKRV